MSEVLTFNTESNTVVKESEIVPLTIYSDAFGMLKEVMPEYTDKLPNNNMERFSKQMHLTRKMYNGIGLAANQCGIRARIFVLGTGDRDDFKITCINPRVVKQSDNIVRDKEGCLSYPALYVTIGRPDNIDVEFTNEKGELVNMNLTGLTARCFLHELDHLNGVLMADRVGKTSMMMAKEKQMKQIKKIERKHKRGIRI
jgi:peptide deformylase